jgi:glyoxylase I family protein
VPRIHHSAVIVSNPEASLRFYRDGLGMDVLMDHRFDGDWPALFGARSGRLRSIFLGDAADPSGGIVELVQFDGGAAPGPAAGPPSEGFFLLSLNVDVDAALERLAGLGVPVEGRTAVPGPDGPVAMATVRDPDGVLIELIGLA